MNLSTYLLVAGWLIAASPVAPADLRIEVRLSELETKDARVEAWTRFSTTATRLHPRVVSTSGESTVLLVPGACNPSLTLVLHTAAVISTSFTPEADGCEGPPLPVRVFRSASVSGELAGLEPRGPTRGELDVRGCLPRGVTGDEPLLSRYPVTVNEQGGWLAALPAMCLALELRVPSYAPARWSEVRLEPMARLRLGLRLLTRAAAARVHVRDGQGLPVAGASVYSVHPEEWEQVVGMVIEGGKPSGIAPVMTGADGRVLVDGLAPGVGRFVVLASGHAAGFSEPAVLEPGAEHDVPPVTLGHPRRLTVRVERDPSVTATLEIRAKPVVRGEPMGGGGAAGTPTDEGAEFAALYPGTWRVTVVAFSSGYGEVAAEADVLIGDADATVAVPLFAAYFTGQLVRDGLPVAGRVEVMPAAGGLKASTMANEEGLFRVHLPGPGAYHVVYSGTPEETGAALDVRFDSPDEVVSVHLRDGVVSGRVVDQHGAPVADATVRLEYREMIGVFLLRTARTDHDGAFTAPGLPEGLWLVEASEGGRVSERERTVLRPRSAATVRLTVTSPATMHGTVLTADGERVPGVSGTIALEEGDDARFYRVSQFRTDASGEFSLRFPRPGPQALNVEVYGAEHGLTAVRVRPSDRLEVRLPRATGSVVVRFDEPLQPAGRVPGHHLLVSEDGAYMYVGSVTAREGAHVWFSRDERGVLLHVEHLAPGRWRLVRLTPDDFEGWRQHRDDPARLAAEFTVEPGRMAIVTVR